MKRRISAFLFMLTALSTAARSVEISGGNWQGADLTPSNYDMLKGTFTNVGTFRINSGVTAFVAQETPLVVYAASVTINGKLDGSGSGRRGGTGGASLSPGNNGLGGGPSGQGGGFGAVAPEGGGGGGGHAYANNISSSGGAGFDVAMGGPGSAGYGSTGTISIPLSPDDVFQGSGGGGGGGGSTGSLSGVGGAGGGGIYIEAGYITVTGTITVDGMAGGAGLSTEPGAFSAAGGGGGGAGGSVLLKSKNALILSSSVISSQGGAGGTAIEAGGLLPTYPGGGGAAGRIKLVYRNTAFSRVIISTAGGAKGDNFMGDYGAAGSTGAISYGIMASSPSGFAFVSGQVFKTSAAYSWDPKNNQEWGKAVSYLPDPTTYQFRLYESTAALPLDDHYRGIYVSSTATTLTETGLSPDTTIYRMLTAYTDFGDSASSNWITARTIAAAPFAQAGTAFTVSAYDSISFAWSSGTAAAGFNPTHTRYEISRSTYSDFSAYVSTNFVVAASSSPAGLAPNTTYYFRVRALGINGVYTDFTLTLSTPTLAAAPASPSFTGVYTDSITFSWSGGQNPSGTLFEAQLSMDNFVSVHSSATTLLTSADFTGLNPGAVYSLRARAINHALRPTDFTLTLSTTVGQLGSLEAPAKPAPPSPTAAYSYDGAAVFNWSHPSGVIPYRYWLEIGSTPGGKDFLSDYFILAAAPLTYSTTTLVSGQTYYARVRAQSAAGVLGEFSQPGPGIAVWISDTQTPVAKPYNWPNPFDPAGGATSIGFYLKAEADVAMRIFTLQGIPVYEAAGHEASGGNKVWRWNGRNGDGRMVEPGGYVCLITKKYSGKTEVQKFKLAVLY